MSDKTRKVAVLGLLSAVALALAAIENMLPTSAILPPGVKLGLSNIVTMFTAYFMSFSGAGIIVVIKAGFAFITRGAVAGILSLSGGVISAVVVCFIFKFKKKYFSFMGISILGAVAHNITQIAVVTVITGSPAYFYLPILVLSAVATGTLNAIILKGIFPYMKRIFPERKRQTVAVNGKELKPRFYRGGVFLPHRKNTAEVPTMDMPTPKKVTLLMSQHIGAPCIPMVKVGDTVKVGQKIGDCDKPVSSPIHASVSGKVTAIKSVRTASGAMTQAVEIESDGEMAVCETVMPHECNTREEFVSLVRESGLVGLGGAGFPTHIKLSPSEDKTIDTLIINCAECEPYITADYRECIENSWDVLSGVYTVKKMLGIERAIIAVEDNKPEAIRVLQEIADSEINDPTDKVQVIKLKSKYPQGAEKTLVYAVTGRKIPTGKLPADVGVIVMNVTSAAFISRYLKTGMPLVSKRITVDGGAVSEAKNIRVPIGTSVNDILDFVGVSEPKKILLGGPMMGQTISDIDTPIVKGTNAVLAFDEKEVRSFSPTPCIRCGRCVAACPMSLMPTSLERLYEAGDIKGLEENGLMTCMECGCCAYSCPANHKLVQNLRLAKQLVKSKIQ